MTEPIKVFLSYSHKDDELKKEFCDHLAILQHNQLIAAWQDRNIDAGTEWADAIHQNLEQAEIILLLVSSAFMASRYCYSIEMQQALKRHKSGAAIVIPVIIRDSSWTTSPLGQLQAVPRDNRAVATWGDQFARDTAWRQVTEEITKVVQGMIDRRQSESLAVQKANAIQVFRAKAEDFYKDGVLSPGEKALLDLERKRLGLDKPEAEEVLGAVKSAYQQHQADLECYRQTLIAEWAGQDELRADQWELLQQLQTALVISDPEVEQIRQVVLAERVVEQQQAQEAADRQAQEAERQQQQTTEARLSREVAEQQRTLEAQRQQEAEDFWLRQDREAKVFDSLKLDLNSVHRESQNIEAKHLALKFFFQENLELEVTLEMILIPSGKFSMGSSNGEGYDDEYPRHEVEISEFYMSKFLVTQKQWKAVTFYANTLDKSPSFYSGDLLPVESINWFEASNFCKELSTKTDKSYRLPTEAEWEYACRAGTESAFSWGNNTSVYLMNHGNHYGHTTEVDRFQPNNFGLYDMHGNVWEWCSDMWHKNYINAPHDGSSWEDRTNIASSERILRGGSWDEGPKYCRSANRGKLQPNAKNNGIGFRLVCEITQ
jgi:formylglycine-generating enzyme required for sulfatase activity